MTEVSHTDSLKPLKDSLPVRATDKPLGVGNGKETGILDQVSSLALSDILNTLSDMVCVSVDGEIRHVNDAGVQILGADTAEQLLGVSFQSLICDDFAATIDDFLAVVAGEDPTPIRVKGPGGKQASLSVQVKALPELGERAYLITAHNLTRQVELSEAVHKGEVRFRKLVNSALDLICVLENGVITYINRAGLNLLRAAFEDEVVGKRLGDFLHPDYEGVLDGDLSELANEAALIPICLRDISQNTIDAEMGLTVLETGRTVRCMVEVRDITAHNRAVSALRQSIDTLEQRVKERTRELEDEVMERRRAEEMLRHVASHDGLTDLPNRSLLMDRLDRAIHRSHRDAKKCAVLFIDLDGFKPINDTLGHDMGDLLLREVAQRLTESIRETDTAARFGGDEFVVLLTDLQHIDDTAPAARKILDNLCKPVNLNGTDATIGASIGVALYPDHGENAEAVLKKADDAMYEVKESGKNNFAIAALESVLPGLEASNPQAD